MILADSSIWIDHIRKADQALLDLLNTEEVWGHPFVLGELAMGSLPTRLKLLGSLKRLPSCVTAKDHYVLTLIEEEKLFGLGIGYIDAHLLASARLTPHTQLWTRDKRLQAAAERLSLAYPHLGRASAPGL